MWRALVFLTLSAIFAAYLLFDVPASSFHATTEVTTQPPRAQPYWTYPRYNSPDWKRKWRSDYVACEGPRGTLLNESHADIVHGYHGLSRGYARSTLGSAELLSIDTDTCFTSTGRLGPYGYELPDQNEQTQDYINTESSVDWSHVRWGELQSGCLQKNKHRYRAGAKMESERPIAREMPSNVMRSIPVEESHTHKRHQQFRQALLIRTWTGYRYTENDLHSIRALVTELSLLSGGEYTVLLLVHVKDDLWTDSQDYQRILDAHIPREFHGISVLWHEQLLQDWYPLVGDWQVYWHQFMPVQWFSKIYPEFDFVWNWEMDTRSLGNHYYILEHFAKFAKKTPRKYLWERNARLYIPDAHGPYDRWLAETHKIVDSAVTAGEADIVWGPRPYNTSSQQPIGPTPPTALTNDDFSWGVGEEADLITLLPIWDPTHTEWVYKDKIFNFVPDVRPHFSGDDPLDINFHHPEFINIPRRVYINTVSRFSRRQLHAMHLENIAGRTMAAEMWPATAALHHGLKAVYVPHPIWADRRWTAGELDAVFNADGNETAQWSARADSVYNQDREGHFGGFTWFFNAKYAQALYRAWLGVGSIEGVGDAWPRVEGDALCLPAMLLHPIKQTAEHL